MKSDASASLLAEELTIKSVPPAGGYHTANDKGIFETPEKIFVPMPVGNICCGYIAQAAADEFYFGFDFFMRQPKNHVTQMPSINDPQGSFTDRAWAELAFLAEAKTWFSDHKTLLDRIEKWAASRHFAAGRPATPDELPSTAGAAVSTAPAVDTALNDGPMEDNAAAGVPYQSGTRRFDAIAVDDIELNPQNPRKQRTDASLAELADSIKAQGELLQPIAVRDMGDPFTATSGKRYRLIFGEGRLLAHRLLKWEKIDAKIYTGLTAADALAKALVENLSREDMNAMDEAEGFAELSHLGWKPAQMSERTGKDERTIQRALSLVKLPDDVRAMVRSNELSARQARSLIQWVSAKGADGKNRPGDFVARPEVCSVIARMAAKHKISSDDLALGVPICAINELRSLGLCVQIPFQYFEEAGAHASMFDAAGPSGVERYTFDLAWWKQRKKDIDANRKAAAAEAADKAAKKLESRVSIPVADLKSGKVQHAELAAEDVRYADHLPEGAVVTGIGKDKSEVLICVNPDALKELKARESAALFKDQSIKIGPLQARATAALKKLKKVGPREMAVLAAGAVDADFAPKVDRLYNEAWRMQGLKMPLLVLDASATAAWQGLAKLEPAIAARVYIQALLYNCECECDWHSLLELLRWILNTPKLGLIVEDNKAREQLLAKLAAELWPKPGTPAAVQERIVQQVKKPASGKKRGAK